jgi:hypothetical protein
MAAALPLCFLLLSASRTLGAQNLEQSMYAAPEATGNGSGASVATPANFRDLDFWSRVQQSLRHGPVTVNFLAGAYLVSSDKEKHMPQLQLSNMGHETNRLTIQGIAEEGVVFTRHPDDSMEGQKGPGLFSLSGCRNVLVRNLHFTAKQPIGYATHFGSRNLVIEGCSWIDLPGVYYGASGTSGADTDHVTFRNCVFKRVGSGGHAHMVYNAYDPKHIRFVGCHFEDCAGDYVRFRDGTDFGVVTGCTFKSTGTYLGGNLPFITVPLFNDDDPSKNPRNPNYEYFGTHFLIFGNTFFYPEDSDKGTRAAFLFHHSGFDPPGRNHLLTPEEAATLANGTTAQRKALMLSNLGIDTNAVHYYSNEFVNVQHVAAYRAAASYGAKSRGWGGTIDVADLLNPEPVANGTEEALAFFEHP